MGRRNPQTVFMVGELLGPPCTELLSNCLGYWVTRRERGWATRYGGTEERRNGRERNIWQIRGNSGKNNMDSYHAV